MLGNNKVFISHAHEDNSRCTPLIELLRQWPIDYWFDTEQIYAGDYFAQLIEQELRDRDIFIRVCSRAAQNSYWVGLETGAFHCLMAENYRQGLRDKRRLVNLILDPDYDLKSEPFVNASKYIDAVHDAGWREELHRALLREVVPISSAPVTVLPIAGAHVFIDDDNGYMAWIRTNPAGFVLNSYRSPNPDYVMLHKATCGWIQRPIKHGDRLTDTYIKICSGNLHALNDWSREQAKVEAHPCGLCKPQSAANP